MLSSNLLDNGHFGPRHLHILPNTQLTFTADSHQQWACSWLRHFDRSWWFLNLLQEVLDWIADKHCWDLSSPKWGQIEWSLINFRLKMTKFDWKLLRFAKLLGLAEKIQIFPADILPVGRPGDLSISRPCPCHIPVFCSAMDFTKKVGILQTCGLLQ